MKKQEWQGRFNPFWLRMAGLVSAIFFIYLADAMLSFWVPGLLEEIWGSGLLMGLVMSFSSVVGLGVDLAFPQIVKEIKATYLFVFGVVVGILFSGVMGWVFLMRGLWLVLVGMGLWGVYYEILIFAKQQYVAERVRVERRSGVWAILRTFSSLAYVFGPLLAGGLLMIGVETMLMVAIGLAVLGGGMIILISDKKGEREWSADWKHVNLKDEIVHWLVLLPHIWPILVLSLIFTLIDSSFWTIGAVLSARLLKESWWGGLWIPAYLLPSLFAGGMIVKWGIYRRKKIWATGLMAGASLVLGLQLLDVSLPFRIALVFVAGMLASVALPLIDAVYTDLLSRMGRERKHLVGLSSSMGSIAFVFGPILVGGASDFIGEIATFGWLGIFGAVVCVGLFLVMPRKLRLPQGEIKEW